MVAKLGLLIDEYWKSRLQDSRQQKLKKNALNEQTEEI